jgi:hypothetical protein
MAKRRDSNDNQVSLFPFLSILACLIGALVMIIVVMVTSQANKADGRTPEEIKTAQEFLKIQKEIEERKKLDVTLKDQIVELEKVEKDLEEKQTRFLKLRKLLDSSNEVQAQNKIESARMQKELDDLLVEIEGITKQVKESKIEIANLMAEIKKRQVPLDKKPPAVVVQPGGSGMPEGTKVFFVEASGGALKILGAWGEDYRLSASGETVVADPNYNYLLTEMAKNPKSILLFLIRDDGQGAFANGGGRAQNDYNVRIAKLPIPGRGDLDLKLFEKFRGTLPPPLPASPTGAPTPPPPAPKS